MPGSSKRNSKKITYSKGPCQDSSQPAPAKKYGKAAQVPIPEDNTKELSKDKKNCDQQVVGSIFYYAQAANITLLIALSTIPAELSKFNELSLDIVKQILDYCTMHPIAKFRYETSKHDTQNQF